MKEPLSRLCDPPSQGGRFRAKQPFNLRRLRDYDYARGASLFITLSTDPRRRLFGRVDDARMALSPFGAEVEVALAFTFAKAPGFRLYGHVVMPDHVHFRIYLEPGVESSRAPALINTVVGRFKSNTTHLYHTKYGGHGTLWQASFHDWLCRGREMIDSVERYMGYNALKWWLRHGHPRGGGWLADGAGGGLLALREPLTSARLGGQEYWRGLGSVEILDEPRPMIALRVSRRCGERDVAALLSRLMPRIGEFSIISGFISPGERIVLTALLANTAAKFVKVSPYALSHDYSPPVTLMPAIVEGRCAVIARGNSPEEISRGACLDLNTRIIDIADKAYYAVPREGDGLRR